MHKRYKRREEKKERERREEEAPELFVASEALNQKTTAVILDFSSFRLLRFECAWLESSFLISHDHVL